MSVIVSPRFFISAPSICRSCRLRILRHQNQVLSPQQQQQQQQQAQRHPFQRRFIATKGRPRKLSTVPAPDDNTYILPRWAATPQSMRAPHRLNPRTANDEFPVNEDPDKLKQAYVKLLGSENAAEQLPEHLRWLAVTHKSYDHGRSGFNDRLAFLGKRLVDMHACLALIEAPLSIAEASASIAKDAFGRKPFKDKATEGLEHVAKKESLVSRERLARLAKRYDLTDVIRWKPKLVNSLQESGLDNVLAHTLYAVVGAVALQRGGEEARNTVHKRILDPLGVFQLRST